MIIKYKNFICLGLALVAAMMSVPIEALADGIVYNGKEYGSGENISIDADSSKTYSFTAQLPATTFASLQWSTYGGIKIVGKSTGATVTIQCESGTTYETGYSLYAKGRLTLTAVKETTPVPEGCEECLAGIVCNPNYTYSLNIYKTFDWSGNAIVGDKCAQAGDSITFSVAPWVSMYQPNDVGFDTYEWDIPESLNASKLYYSADKSSVTFVASEKIEGQVIKARMGKYNIDANNQEPLTLTLSNDIPKPEIDGMSSNDTYCLPVSTQSASFIVTNASPGAKYIWDMRTWDILSLSANGDTVTFRPRNNEQVVQLQVEGGCTAQSYLYQINRSLTSDATIENGYGDPYCLPAGKSVELSVDSIPDGTSLKWKIEGDGWDLPETEKNKAKPKVTTGTGPATVTVYSSNCPTPELTATLNIEPQKPANIDGPACLTFGESETLTYSVAAVDNAAQYEWSYPSTWTVSGADNQNTITLISDGQTADSVKVRAIGCNESEWSKLAVKMDYPAPKGISIISDCLNPGLSTDVQLEVVPPDGVSDDASYEWTIVDSLKVESKREGKTVVFNTMGHIGNFVVEVKVSGSCGTGSEFTDTITIVPGFTLYTEIRRTKREIGIEQELEGVVNYTWYVGGKYRSSGQYDSYVDITPSSSWGDYFYEGSAYVIVHFENGCYAKAEIPWNEKQIQQLADEVGNNKSLSLADGNESVMKVSPNPTSGDVQVSFSTPEERRIAIISLNGEIVLSTKVSETVNSISLAGVAPGLYSVVAIDSESKYYSKLLVK